MTENDDHNNDARDIQTFEYDTLRKELLEAMKLDLSSIISTEFAKLKNEPATKNKNPTEGSNKNNLRYENEMLRKEIQNKDLVIQILNQQLNTLQEITKNITSTEINKKSLKTQQLAMEVNSPIANISNTPQNKSKKSSKVKKPSSANEITIKNNIQTSQGDNASNQSIPTSDKKEAKNKYIHTKEKSQKKDKRRLAIILGDSITKDIKPWEISKGVNAKVINQTFSRATTERMIDYVKPSKKERANVYILHFGTNDLRTEMSAKEIAEKIIMIGSDLKTSENEICISEICQRGDDFNSKAMDVNKELKGMCVEHNFFLCNNENIKPSFHLNRSNLHLNTKGSRILQNKFLNILRY